MGFTPRKSYRFKLVGSLLGALSRESGLQDHGTSRKRKTKNIQKNTKQSPKKCTSAPILILACKPGYEGVILQLSEQHTCQSADVVF